MIEVGRVEDTEVMQSFLEGRLEAIEWPRETQCSLEVDHGGMVALLDVDLPEIEDMPTKEASVVETQLRLKYRDLTETDVRRLYMLNGI